MPRGYASEAKHGLDYGNVVSELGGGTWRATIEYINPGVSISSEAAVRRYFSTWVDRGNRPDSLRWTAQDEVVFRSDDGTTLTDLRREYEFPDGFPVAENLARKSRTVEMSTQQGSWEYLAGGGVNLFPRDANGLQSKWSFEDRRYRTLLGIQSLFLEGVQALPVEQGPGVFRVEKDEGVFWQVRQRSDPAGNLLLDVVNDRGVPVREIRIRQTAADAERAWEVEAFELHERRGKVLAATARLERLTGSQIPAQFDAAFQTGFDSWRQFVVNDETATRVESSDARWYWDGDSGLWKPLGDTPVASDHTWFGRAAFLVLLLIVLILGGATVLVIRLRVRQQQR